MKKYLYMSLTLAVLSTPVFAQVSSADDCDADTQDCRDGDGRAKEPNKTIYPYKPFSTQLIQDRLKAINEGTNYVSNVFEMDARGLNAANTAVQPWGGPYWPLYQGMVGNTYQDKDYNTFIFTALKNLNWQKNVSDYKKRKEKVHPKIYDLSEEDLAKMSPSEKYDLLLGDTSFDLTNRVWNYAEKWGNEKRWGFLSAINIPEGHRLPKTNNTMALWEGICHGWTVASIHMPRPEKTVTVTLPNGKRMPFYPNDIKALQSLLWAHSTVQSDVIFEGNRCNKKKPEQDKYGRFIDIEVDRDDSSLVPRCADTHPGIFHAAMVNVLGIEGRGFVVDVHAEAAIGNQPVSGYEITYFNPRTGKDGTLAQSVMSRVELDKNDLYAVSRNTDSTHIVGVHVKLKYIDWEFAKKKETNSEKDDKIKDIEFNYDLELDASGKIVGGQWRVNKKISEGARGKTGQPDFFWVVPRNWREYFKPVSGLPEWNFAQNTLPPSEFQQAARNAHSFVYEESKKFFGYSPQCPVFSGKKDEGPVMVDCEFKFPKPQPLINVVNTLLEESRK